LEVVQIIVHRLTSLVIGGSFQSIDCVHFHVNRKEVDPELFFEVLSGLDGENASVHFLIEYVFGLLGCTTAFEECEGPEDFLLFIMELLWGQADVERTGVQKCVAVVMFSAKVRRIGELGTCPSRRRSRGQRYWRRWYKWGKCVWYGRRGGISH